VLTSKLLLTASQRNEERKLRVKNTIIKIRNEEERDNRSAIEDGQSLMLTSPVPNSIAALHRS
jgi:demethoxyubiquinone hydroxylase (CLK1/Coq7/Cat5 family)